MSGARRTARRPCLVIGCLLLAACAAAPPPRPRLPEPPDARLAAVRAREEAVRSLRARFRSTVHLPDSQRSADGVLLVDKPDRFRLRLLLPFGLTVFDYLSVGERSWTALPLADAAQREQLDEFSPFSREDLGEAFLRGAHAFPGHCVARAGAPVLVECRSDDRLRRTLSLGPDGIVEETSYDDAGAARMVIRYADYRSVSGSVLPFHIVLDYPQRRQSVDIAIDSYEVNPTLSAASFDPPDGVAATIER
jgi:outer membrane lipoprotein-sorting protein